MGVTPKPRCPDAAAPEAEIASLRRTIQSTLDPLLQGLSRDYVDDADLSERIKKLFEASRRHISRKHTHTIITQCANPLNNVRWTHQTGGTACSLCPCSARD